MLTFLSLIHTIYTIHNAHVAQGKHHSCYMRNRVTETIFIEPIYTGEVSDEIFKMNDRKSAGSDQIIPKNY